VRELPDAHFLEVGALGVKEVVVYALARNTGDCVLANGGHVGAGFGWPVVVAFKTFLSHGPLGI